MPLRAIVARRRSRPMARRSALASAAMRQNSAVTCGDGREIEAVGFDDAALRIALAIALAVRAVLHADEAELDQAAIDCLDLRRRQAERLLLHARRGPDDRPAVLLPVLRLREAEQPVERMHQARRDTEMRRRRLEGGQQLATAP